MEPENPEAIGAEMPGLIVPDDSVISITRKRLYEDLAAVRDSLGRIMAMELPQQSVTTSKKPKLDIPGEAKQETSSDEGEVHEDEIDEDPADTVSSEQAAANQDEEETGEASGRPLHLNKKRNAYMLPNPSIYRTPDGEEFRLPVIRFPEPGARKTWFRQFKAWTRVFWGVNEAQLKMLQREDVRKIIQEALDQYIKEPQSQEWPEGIQKITGDALSNLLKKKFGLKEAARDPPVEKIPVTRADPPQKIKPEENAMPTASEWAALLGGDASSSEYSPLGVDGAMDEAPPKKMGKGFSAMGEGVEPVTLTPSHGHRIPTGEEELRQQRKYFSGLTDPSQVCLLCASPRHRAAECPVRHCEFCASEDHSKYRCPTRTRCQKCRQLGHRKETCTEKLALAEGEQTLCAFCSSPLHREESCDQFWRSYEPFSKDTGAFGIDSIRKFAPEHRTVKFIPAFCGTCGEDGHYIFDCSLRGLQRMPTAPTWSMLNHALYVDPDSKDEPIIFSFKDLDENVPVGPTPPPGKVRGKPRANVVFENDDSEVEFLSERVQKRERPGQIRVASNIQFRADQQNPVHSLSQRSLALSQLPPVARPIHTGNPAAGASQQSSMALPSHLRGPSLPNPPLPPGPPPSGFSNFSPGNQPSYASVAEHQFQTQRAAAWYMAPDENQRPRHGQQGYHSVAPPVELHQPSTRGKPGSTKSQSSKKKKGKPDHKSNNGNQGRQGKSGKPNRGRKRGGGG